MVSGVPQADKATDLMVANSGMQSPGTRTFSVGTAATTISTGATLYPFNDGYVIWAGNVRRRRPAHLLAAGVLGERHAGRHVVRHDPRARAEHPRQARHDRRAPRPTARRRCASRR